MNRTWQVTTAIRVFALAAGTGRALASSELERSLVPLMGLALIAIIGAAADLDHDARRLRWTPVVEAMLVAAWLAMAAPGPDHFMVYLAVPPVIAGVRHGWVMATNTCLAATLSLSVVALTDVRPHLGSWWGAVLFWLAMGLGCGWLAGWQTRSIRALEQRHGPHLAAHTLMAQLHELTRRGSVGLDAGSLATELETALRAETGAESSAVFVHLRSGELAQLSSYGDSRSLADHLAPSAPPLPEHVSVVPLRDAVRRSGSVVLTRRGGWTPALEAAAQGLADEYVLRLDTAVLFDELRHMAMAEERHRIARDMHDGVAQEIVALGYVVDEIESTSTEPETVRLAASLRDEISRLVTEIRFSIFDLRHHVSEHRLSGALGDYVHAVSSDSDLRVHLVLDESGPALTGRVEAELLRIAQEAIGNVRKHASAANLWVTLVSDGSCVVLTVEDDGVGNAAPKERHWGLQTMQERAESISATLTIEPRAPHGTTVRLQSRRTSPPEGSARHGHHSPARR